MPATTTLLPPEQIEQAIRLIRSQRVILDSDIANLYGIETKALVQAVKRNLDRFPADFMFRLTSDEYKILRSQTVTSRSWGGRRYPPYAFTEQGVAMLSSVIRSPQAVAVNIEIMRTFVRLRQLMADHDDLRLRLETLEIRYDAQFQTIFDAIRQLMEPPESNKPAIGFKVAPRARER
jgi:hypothetical protein